ncbi:UNVERIFIED_CONTAM: hypothetical protein B566_EDAN016757 [Ephemera danica]|nr:hypothetical protein B566_EDAN016757 [Ephemera danica]
MSRGRGGSQTVTFTTTYSPTGKKASQSLADGTVVTYAYDPSGGDGKGTDELTAIDISGTGTISMGPRHWGQPGKTTSPGGSQRQNDYDPLLRLKQIQVKSAGQQPLMNCAYRFDAESNITGKQTEYGDTAYGYDSLYRLTQVTPSISSGPGLPTERYTYDKLGNRLTDNNRGGTNTWQYDGNNQLTQSFNADQQAVTEHYDANGSLIRKSTPTTDPYNNQKYLYDAGNRLTEVQTPTGDKIASYQYDPLGRRIRKTEYRSLNGSAWLALATPRTTTFFYTDEGLAAEYQHTGSNPAELKTQYGWEPNGMWGTSPLFLKTARVGETSPEYFYAQNDHLGTPQQLIDQAGNLVWAQRAEAFGKTNVVLEKVENNLRFPGQYYDQETNTHYNYFRDYEPGTGRYLQFDPIGLGGGINGYGYVGGNPLSRIDPTGEFAIPVIVYYGAVALVVAVIANNAGRGGSKGKGSDDPFGGAAGASWRDAILLKKGGKLLLKGGDENSEPAIEITEIRTEQANVPVFNIEVANAHTYFIGVDGTQYGWEPNGMWGTSPLFLKTARVGETSPEYFYAQNDHLGTPQQLIDQAGNLVWAQRAEAFGKTNVVLEKVENNLRFPGQYYDQETNTHYNYFRDYEPGTGRYVQRDPIGYFGGMNVYGYVGGKALTKMDRMGLAPDECEAEPDCTKASKFQLREAGITDEHGFKTDWGGVPNSRYDICACKDGSIVIKAQGNCGRPAPSIQTDANWKKNMTSPPPKIPPFGQPNPTPYPIPPFDDVGPKPMPKAPPPPCDCPANRLKTVRWLDRNTGQWMDYERASAGDLQLKLVRYGNRNDLTTQLIYDPQGKLQSVKDHQGNTVLQYLYTGEQLTEIRDNPGLIPGNTAAPRAVKYTYTNLTNSQGTTYPSISQVTDVLGNITRYTYTGTYLATLTDPEGRIRRYDYTADRVTQYTDADGQVTRYVYDYDKLKKEFYARTTHPATAAGSRIVEQWYDLDGRVVRRDVNGQSEYRKGPTDTATRSETRTDGAGRQTVTTQDEYGNTIKTVYPDGSTTSAKYSAVHGQLTEETDELGIKTQYQYDSKGNLLKKTEAVGLPEERITDYEVNSLGQITKETRKGRTEAHGTVTPDALWQIEYDAQGQISKTTDPEGKLRQYTYDRTGHLAIYTDPKGNTTRYQVDAEGRLSQVTDALGRVRSYQYDKVGNLIQKTDARGKAVQMAYDAMNRPTQTTNPVGGVYKLQYNAQGLPITETDEDGRITQAEFDNFLRLTKEIDGLGNITEYAYTLPDGTHAGSLGSLYSPTETKYPTFTERLRFDARERPTSQTLLNPNSGGVEGLISKKQYDKRGQLLSETDANGKTRYNAYDALGRLIQMTDSLGNKTLAHYDARGNLIRLTDPKGNAHQFAYDRNDRLIKEIQPLGQATSYSYDAAGRLSERLDPNGNKLVYAYDAVHRVESVKQYKTGNQWVRTTTTTWDPEDNLTAWNDTDNTRPAGQQSTSASLTYDDAGRRTGETVTYPAGNTLSYRYAYSAAGNKTKLVWPDGTEITYGYSAHGELATVSIPGEGSISVGQYKWFEPTKTTLPGGVTLERTLDGLLYPESIKVKTPGQQTVLSVANTWGKVQELKTSNRTDASGGNSSTKNSSFVYDDETQLTQSTVDSGGLFGTDTESFTLDAAGNRIAHSPVPGTWTYDANNRLLQRGSAGSYQYDDNGNLTQETEGGQVTRYTYDPQNRLTELRNGNGQLIVRYGYDPLDRRLWKEQYRDKAGNALAQAKRTYYLYADEGLIGEAEQAITLNPDNSVSANGAAVLATQYGPRPNAEFTTGMLFVKTKNSNGQDSFAYFHHDHLGTPIQATDKQGNVVWAASYNVFGKAAIITPAATADKPTIDTNLRLPGQYHDTESGLHYNYRRYYDPETGRYVTQDPIGLEGGFNLYGYVNGNPVNLMDPTGEVVFLAPLVVAAARAYATCVLECTLMSAAGSLLSGECLNLGQAALDCAKDCLLGLGLGKALGWVKKAFNSLPCVVNSFPGETLVHVKPTAAKHHDAKAAKAELKPISQIKVGDEVLAWAEWKARGSVAGRDERLSYEKVTDVFLGFKEQVLVHLTLDNGETLTATEGHPFKTNEGWRDAILLKKGGKLLLKGGDENSEPAIEITEIRTERKTLPVYNIEVANAHTYFVGIDGVGVHNGRCTPAMRRAWEKLHGRDWPKNPMTEKIRPGGNQDGHHITPVSKGGHPTDPRNITPKTPSDHMDWHKANGYK